MKYNSERFSDLYIFRPDSRLKYVVPLDNYHVPFNLRKSLNQGKLDEDLLDLLDTPIDMKNHHHKFSTLLHIEELQREVDIHHYDMENATLHPEGKFLVLQVHKVVI